MKLPALLSLVALLCLPGIACAEPPGISYIFPAGARQGAELDVRVGGFYLHDQAAWEMQPAGVVASPQLTRIERLWFEGPLIRQPASQQKEDYPQDYTAHLKIASDAALGVRSWRAWNGQGVTPTLKFVVGNLPEIVEAESDGFPIPTRVELPVTINGRIFPREDVDLWSFSAQAGQSITCSVAAESLGSPLEARLEILDAHGKQLAESGGQLRVDPEVQFTAAKTGVYQVRICDSKFSGLQNHVYRLTITADAWVNSIYPLGGKRGQTVEVELTGQALPANKLSLTWPDRPPGITEHAVVIAGQPRNLITCDIDELDEVLEPAAGARPHLKAAMVANGRIANAGERDAWPFTATKGQPLKFELRAARLNSPLDGVVAIENANGQEIARAPEKANGELDCELAFTPPADGDYFVVVRDRFASRGGPKFAYRLRVTPVVADYQVAVATDFINVEIGSEKKLPVTIERSSLFKGPIKLSLAGLPTGATVAEVAVAPNQNRAELVIKLAAEVAVGVANIQVQASADHNGQTLSKTSDKLRLGCALPTPFRFRGSFDFRYVARGGTLQKSFQIERNGYEGPLEVRLADRQGRHLQGVVGPVVMVPPEASSFDYTVSLPPWMELGRTSRANLMLTGEVADSAGNRHKVCFSTTEQNEQLIALVAPAPLRIALAQSVMTLPKERTFVVPVQLHRDRSLTAPIRLELIPPAHLKSITAESIIVPPGEMTAELHFQRHDMDEPLNAPFILRGTTEHDGRPLVAETSLEWIRSP